MHASLSFLYHHVCGLSPYIIFWLKTCKIVPNEICLSTGSTKHASGTANAFDTKKVPVQMFDLPPRIELDVDVTVPFDISLCPNVTRGINRNCLPLT